MNDSTRDQYLRIALVVFGIIFIAGVLPLMHFWPAGWRWIPNQTAYEHMIVGVYATLGVFLLLASRAPRRNRSLILFTAWSSLVHAGVMAMHALQDSAERGHLIGDVPAVALVGIVLLVLAPREVEVPQPAASTIAV